MRNSKNILEVSYDSGLSSPGRLHDLFIHCEAVTPGEYKARGEGLRIKYGFCHTPFGKCCIASTEKGICNLKFVKNRAEREIIAWLKKQWEKAILEEDGVGVEALAERIFSFIT